MRPPDAGGGPTEEATDDGGRSTAFWIAIVLVLAIPVLLVVTVILAGVIGAFALGIGGEAAAEAPQILLETDEGQSNVTFSAAGVSDSQPPGTLRAAIGDDSARIPGAYPLEAGDEIVVAREGGDVAIGDRGDWSAGERVRIVWVSEDGSEREVLVGHVLERDG